MNPHFAPARAGWLGIGLLCASLGLSSCGGGGGNGPARPIVQATPIAQTTPAPPAPNTGGSTRCSTSYDPNYVGSLDPDHGGDNPVLRWGRFPLRVYFRTDGFYTAARQAQAVRGFNRWVTATGSDGVTYNVVNSSEGADIVVNFNQFTSASEGILGITRYSYDPVTSLILVNREVAGKRVGPVTIEINITGDDNTDLGTDVHEFGHALGINGHSPNRGDLMFPEGNDELGGIVNTRDLNTLLSGYCGNFNKNTNTRLAPSSGQVVTVEIQETADEGHEGHGH